MTNGMVGESWKKVKFSDFIYMQRIRDDLNLFSPEVAKFVFQEGTDYAENCPRIIGMKDELIDCLKPLEMRVSKSKEKGKGFSRFLIFCNKNLRLYNNIKEYFIDIPELNSNSNSINKKIDKLQELTGLNLNFINSDLVEPIENPEWDDFSTNF